MRRPHAACVGRAPRTQAARPVSEAHPNAAASEDRVRTRATYKMHRYGNPMQKNTLFHAELTDMAAIALDPALPKRKMPPRHEARSAFPQFTALTTGVVAGRRLHRLAITVGFARHTLVSRLQRPGAPRRRRREHRRARGRRSRNRSCSTRHVLPYDPKTNRVEAFDAHNRHKRIRFAQIVPPLALRTASVHRLLHCGTKKAA